MCFYLVFWPGQNLIPILPCIIIMYFRRMFVALIQRNTLAVGSTEAGDDFSTVKDCVMSESSLTAANQSRTQTYCRWLATSFPMTDCSNRFHYHCSLN